MKVLRDGRLADSQAAPCASGEKSPTLASLQHPNIVPIIDTGETADGHRFMAMDDIACKSLDEYLKSRHGESEDPAKQLK